MKIEVLKVLATVMLSVMPLTATAQISDEEKAEGFVSLFNGEDLSEWDGSPALWRAEDGAIVGQTTAENAISANQFIYWKGGDVEDFVLRFDMKINPAGNSGMQYRCWRISEDSPYRLAGYQADCDGAHNYSGILYGEGFRGFLCSRGQETIVGDDHRPKVVRQFADNEELKKQLKSDDWNSFEITADGFHFTHKINGNATAICTDEDKEQRRSSGILGIQIHVGPPMKVEVKNIRMKKLNAQ